MSESARDKRRKLYKEEILKELPDTFIKFKVNDIFENYYKLLDKEESQEKEIERLNNIIDELEEYLNRFLYMLNGILDKDIYEQCQLDDFTMIMEKLQELKGDGSND